MLAETDQILRLSELTDVSTSRNSHKGRKRAGEITIESMIELCRAKGVRNNTGRMTRDQERAIALYWQTGHPEWLQIAARLAYELEQELVGFKYDLPPAEPPRLVGPGLENPGDVYRRMPLNYHRSIDALRVVLREHAHYGEETAEDFEPRGKDRWSEHMRQLVPEIQRVAEHLRAIKSNQSVLRAALAKQRRKLTEQERREVHYAHRLLDEWSEHWQKVFRQISEIQALYEEVDPQALAEAIGHESAAIRAYMQANASRLSDAALIECAYQHFDGRHTTGGVLALVRGRIPRIFGEASDVLYFSGEKAYLFFTRGEHIPVESGIFEVDGYDVQDDSIVVVYDGKPYVLYPTSEVPTQKRLRFYKYAGAPSRVAVLAQD
ncbi:MAG: hypothetical protein D6698_05020 [Gammaproteobacteria bacterium]|nr:MAG: hypothetical protein D6698_05020 [Gammaproteobacteria bacterium]